ncbi:PREDICTED: uncharacterized protein LOC109189230 isoform X2 [Ipomoea nil]|uniref:uncharacterized protein LOC109189230 isoform X2 n=1 Tax=Ipomoea nil TaxID=35883 RepID=UPI000900F043|nr:PREDICTED: uncharacterized protein LOC109189230 isoform X2 [Ipomoea nil]
MGTKIQCKTVLPAFYSVKDLNGNVSNGMCLLSHDERTVKIGQHYDSFSPRFPMDGYFEYEKEKVRQTILKHELTFRHQLQELHRLYIRQRDLMNDLKMREVHKNHKEVDLSRCLSLTPLDEVKRGVNRTGLFCTQGEEISRIGNEDKQGANSLKRTNCLADLNEPILIEDTPILDSDANPRGIISLVDDGIQKTKKFHENSFMERNGGSCLKQSVHGGNRPERLSFDINADVQSDDLPTAFPSSQAGPSEACEPLTTFPNHPKTELQKKKTIFGVVISSEDNREQFFTASSGNINSLKQSLDFNGGKTHMNGNISSVSSSKETASCKNGASNSSDLSARKVQGCSLLRFDGVNGVSYGDLAPKDNHNYQTPISKQESSKGSLPWFIAKSQHNLQQISRGENCYHMNLDLLQNCSQQFFKKSETDESFSRGLNQKQEDRRSTSINACEPSKADNVKKIFGVQIFSSSGNLKTADSRNPPEGIIDSVTDKGLGNCCSGLKNQIDLNLSLDEEEEPPAPCLPRAVVKIATAEIDLEAPATLEPEENASSLEEEISSVELRVEKSTQPLEEVTRGAAEAIVSISSSSANNLPNETASSDCLKWLADVIYSRVNDGRERNITDASSGKGEPVEESIPDGLDYFEAMTLELRDMKEEGSCYEPSILEINYDEEEESGAATTPKRPRRGQARRGRQRRDFQRDVLPSLVSLSRHEVSEDILTFEELLKTTGSSWQSRMSQRKAGKNGRGRRRCGSSTTPSLIKTATSQPPPPPTNQPVVICTETNVEKTSLTGWGKRTRRLPRQRCQNTNPAPLKQC